MDIKQERMDSLIIEAYENELKGIASFLHEDIAQNLYAIFNHLQYLQRQTGDSKDRLGIDDMVNLTKRTIEDLRILSNDVHPFFHKGIDGALKSLLISIEKRYGLVVEFKELGDKKDYPILTELIAYRTVKEIMNQTFLYSLPKHVEIYGLWGEALYVKVNFSFGSEGEIDRFERLNLTMLALEKRLKAVGGVISFFKKNDKEIEVNIRIANGG